MSRTSMRAVMGAVLLLAAGVTCTEPVSPPPPAPVPGTLTVSVTTPHANDGAWLIRVVGPAQPTSVVSGNAGYAVYSRPGAKSFQAAVFGALASGATLRFNVPDVAKSGEYVVTLVEVSDDGNVLRESLSGYGVSVAP